MSNPFLSGSGSGAGSGNPFLSGSGGSGDKKKSKADLQKQKKNFLTRLASVPGSVAGDLASGGKSALVRTLDVLDRPVQGVKGLAYGKGPEESLKEAWKGLSGKKRFTVEQAITQDENAKLKGFGGFAANFVGDVLLDPLTYATLGTSAVGKAGLKAVGKSLGDDVAKELASKGVRRSGMSRETLEKALRDAAADNPGAALAKGGVEGAVARQLKALERGASGGIKFGGKTVVSGDRLGTFGRKVTEARPAQAAFQVASASPVGTATRATGKFLQGAFIPNAGVKNAFGRETADRFGALIRKEESQAVHRAEDNIVRMNAAAKKADRAKVTDALHDPSLVPSLGAAERKMYDAVDAVRRSDTAAQTAKGTLPEGIFDPDKYFPRTTTKAGEKWFRENADLARKLFGPKHVPYGNVDKLQGYRLARTLLPNAHVREVNDYLAKEASKAGKAVPKGFKFFEDDPLKAFADRTVSANRSVARADFVDNLAKMGAEDGRPLIVKPPSQSALVLSDLRDALSDAGKVVAREGKKANVAAGRLAENRTLRGDVIRRLGHAQKKVNAEEALRLGLEDHKSLKAALKAPSDAKILEAVPKAVRHEYDVVTFNGQKIAAHRRVVDALQSAEELLASDETMRAMASGLQKTSQLWKSMATVLPVSGGFFARNVETNFVAAWLKGLKNPERYAHAMRIQKAAMSGRRAGEIGGKLSGEDRQIWDLAREHGVIGGGFQAQDVGNVTIDVALRSGKGAVEKAKTLKPLRAGRKLNSALENNSRLALFIDQMKKHGDPEEAARTVKEALFDYGELTPFERKYARNVMAFYTFMRKNLELQAKELAKQPGKASAIAHFRDALVGASDPPPEGTETPKYLRDGGGFLVPSGLAKALGASGDEPTFVNPDIGLTAAAETLDPFVKAAQAMVPGGEKVDTRELARSFLNLPSGPVPAAAMAAVERGTGKDIFTGAPSSDGFGTLLAENLVPGLGKTRRAKEDVGDGNWASFLAGLRPTGLTDKRQMGELYRQIEILQELVAEAKRKGKPVPTLKELGKTGSGGGNPFLSK